MPSQLILNVNVEPLLREEWIEDLRAERLGKEARRYRSSNLFFHEPFSVLHLI